MVILPGGRGSIASNLLGFGGPRQVIGDILQLLLDFRLLLVILLLELLKIFLQPFLQFFILNQLLQLLAEVVTAPDYLVDLRFLFKLGHR